MERLDCSIRVDVRSRFVFSRLLFEFVIRSTCHTALLFTIINCYPFIRGTRDSDKIIVSSTSLNGDC